MYTEDQINFMRADIESDFSLTKLIMNTRERFKKEGKDFDKEFKKWEKEKEKIDE